MADKIDKIGQEDFDEYIRAGEPDKRERAYAWRTAIGLQAVDGLQVSDYLKATARRNIKGEITIIAPWIMTLARSERLIIRACRLMRRWSISHSLWLAYGKSILLGRAIPAQRLCSRFSTFALSASM